MIVFQMVFGDGGEEGKGEREGPVADNENTTRVDGEALETELRGSRKNTLWAEGATRTASS